MKKVTRRTILTLAVILFSALVYVSCVKTEVEPKCGSDKPYYCESAQSCCKYRYNDGHGTCWETMEGCRSTGYPCTVCHLQD